MTTKKYNIEHRKTRLQAMVFEDQLAWIKRNQDKNIFKSESEFITHLISLGIKQHKENLLRDLNDD